MDIYCRKCHEAWDNDSLHDEVAIRRDFGDTTATYDVVAAEFRADGCSALWAAFGPVTCNEVEPSPAIDAAYELMGDDMDGAASFLDDARYLGLF